LSARFAFRAWRWYGAAPCLDHHIDELEHDALIGGRKLLDAAQAFEEPGGWALRAA